MEISSPAPDRLLISIDPADIDWLRLGVSWPLLEGERVTGLGARHGLDFDQRGRCVKLGADRRYTGPDCPAEFLEQGGIPQGDYAPVPWLLSSAGWAAWIETSGPGVEVDLSGNGRRSRSGPPPARCACTCSWARPPRRGCGRSSARPACRR